MFNVPSFFGFKGAGAFDPTPLANAFFARVDAATGVSNYLTATEQSAITTLILDLNNYGLWNKMKAIYPMVGGGNGTLAENQAACEQNLISSSFTGAFTSGWTFASTGVKGNGTSAYMDTQFNPNLDASVNGFSFGGYSRNNDISDTQLTGCYDGTRFVQHNLSDGNLFSGEIPAIISYTPSPSQKLFIHRRTSSTFSESYRDGVSLGTNNASSSLVNLIFYIGARNQSPSPFIKDSHEYAFYFLGLDLTNQNALDLTTAVNTFQTTLSRNV